MGAASAVQTTQLWCSILIAGDVLYSTILDLRAVVGMELQKRCSHGFAGAGIIPAFPGLSVLTSIIITILLRKSRLPAREGHSEFSLLANRLDHPGWN